MNDKMWVGYLIVFKWCDSNTSNYLTGAKTDKHKISISRLINLIKECHSENACFFMTDSSWNQWNTQIARNTIKTECEVGFVADFWFLNVIVEGAPVCLPTSHNGVWHLFKMYVTFLV